LATAGEMRKTARTLRVPWESHPKPPSEVRVVQNEKEGRFQDGL